MIKVNGWELKPTIFPDKTSQIWELPPEIITANVLNIVWWFEAEREILDLLSFTMLTPNAIKNLHIPYLPYARQDKDIDNKKTFNLRMFSFLVNNLNCDSVTSVDAHNPKLTAELIENFKNIEVSHIHHDLIAKLEPDYIVYPDLGARDRYSISYERRLIFYKVRDQSTGQITGHDISYRDSFCGYTQHLRDASFIKDNEKFLIIDDLCDGGATFLSIAKKLRETGKKDLDINLFITHGLFSKGREVLTEAGIKLFTTNSLLKNADGYKV